MNKWEPTDWCMLAYILVVGGGAIAICILAMLGYPK